MTGHVRIGISPLIWTNEGFDDQAVEVNASSFLLDARAAGYEGIENSVLFPRDPEALNKLLQEHQLALIAARHEARMMERAVQEELASLEGLLNLLKVLRANVLVISDHSGLRSQRHSARPSERRSLDDDGWDRFARALNRIAENVAAEGIRVAYHPRAGTLVHTEAEIDRLLTNTSRAVSLLLDTGDIIFGGGDPTRVAKKHCERIALVHLVDVRPTILSQARAHDRSFREAVLDGVFTVPGDGTFDFAPILATLSSSSYQGWLVVAAPQDPNKAPPNIYAKLAFGKVVRLAQQAGLA